MPLWLAAALLIGQAVAFVYIAWLGYDTERCLRRIDAAQARSVAARARIEALRHN